LTQLIHASDIWCWLYN